MQILFKYFVGFLFIILLLMEIFAGEVAQWGMTHGYYDTCVIGMSVILLSAGMLILFGKCDWLAADCSFVSEDKIAKYNLPRLRLVATLCLFFVGFLNIYSRQVDAALDANDRFVVSCVLVVVGCLLFWGGRKWAKKKVIRN